MVLFFVGLFFAWAAGWLDYEEEDEDDEPDPIELSAEEDVDPEQLLADLEAQAPEHLDPVERVQWAARQGQRILEEGARKRR
jgi:hypothetical protein